MSAAEESDEALMARYQAGDEGAFRELHARYAGRLTALMRRDVRSAADVQDLVQQTFFQLHRARHDFKPEYALRPWLMTIARNVLRDHFRYTARRPGGLPLLDEPAVAGGPHDAAETRAAVLDAVDGLPESQRVVVRGHWLEHRSHAELARELGISRGAVKVRAHRAYQTLRRVLGAKGFPVR